LTTETSTNNQWKKKIHLTYHLPHCPNAQVFQQEENVCQTVNQHDTTATACFSTTSQNAALVESVSRDLRPANFKPRTYVSENHERLFRKHLVARGQTLGPLVR
jgi:hypothetical protein